MAADLAHREEALVGGVLQDATDQGPPRLRRPGRVSPQHEDLAAGPGAVALEDLHLGGLAGAIRREEGDALADVHPQVHARERPTVAVALREPFTSTAARVVTDAS